MKAIALASLANCGEASRAFGLNRLSSGRELEEFTEFWASLTIRRKAEQQEVTISSNFTGNRKGATASRVNKKEKSWPKAQMNSLGLDVEAER